MINILKKIVNNYYLYFNLNNQIPILSDVNYKLNKIYRFDHIVFNREDIGYELFTKQLDAPSFELITEILLLPLNKKFNNNSPTRINFGFNGYQHRHESILAYICDTNTILEDYHSSYRLIQYGFTEFELAKLAT